MVGLLNRMRQRTSRRPDEDINMRLRNDRIRQQSQPRNVVGGPAAGSSRMPSLPGMSHGSLSGGSEHPAVGFGRDMTRGVGDMAVDQLSRMTYDRLASKGIYKDNLGTWQIQGLERPLDTGRLIRDSAIRAMDPSGQWSNLVAQSEAALRGPVYTPNVGSTQNKPVSTMPSTPGGSGLPPVGQPRPVPGTVPSPGLGGVPQIPTTGRVPSPGLGGVPQLPTTGRVPSPGLGGVPQFPNPSVPANRQVTQPTGTSTKATGTMLDGDWPTGGWPTAPQQTTPNARQQTPTGTSTPAGFGYMSPRPTGMTTPNARMQTPNSRQQTPNGTQNPAGLQTRLNPQLPNPGGQQTPNGTRQPAGPQLPPGFGTPGPTMIPSNPARGVAGLGDSIRNIVMSAIQNPGMAGQQRVGMGPMTAGQPPMRPQMPRIPTPMNGVNLGQQIQQQVQQRLGANRPAFPTPGQTPFPTPGGTGVGPGNPGQPTPSAPTPPGGQPPVAPGNPGQPAPSAPGSLGSPQGQIPNNLNIAYGRGGDWSTVNQYDALFTQYGNQYGVDPAMLKAMAVIESGGQMIWNQNGFPNYGIMQIDMNQWGSTAQSMGYDLNTPEGQIGFAAAFLGGAVPGVTGSDPMERFLNSYYPTDCYECAGKDGHTQAQYVSDMQTLMGIINGAAPSGGSDGTGPIQTPNGQALPPDGTSPRQAGGIPMPQVQQIDNGSPVAAGGVSSELTSLFTPNNPNAVIYGDFKDPTDAPYYDYFEGHGGSANQHTGIDIGGNYGDPVVTPRGGTVVCAGTDNGPGANGSGCAKFNDVSYNGAGRVEIMLDNSNISLIFGHMNTSNFGAGQHVNPGDIMGGMGGMNSDHVHVEARVWCSNGDYQIVDPSLVMAGYYDNYRC